VPSKRRSVTGGEMIGQALFYEGKWRGDDYASYARLHGSQEVDRRCGQ
jgi:hypothetical protein